MSLHDQSNLSELPGELVIELEQPNDVIHILITSMALGGAERIVFDQLQDFDAGNRTSHLYLLFNSDVEYPLENLSHCRVHRLAHLRRREKFRYICSVMMANYSTTLFSHLIRIVDLRELWSFGITTIPVIHNTRQGWKDSPSEYPINHCPIIVCCCRAVENEINIRGAHKSTISIKHEIVVVKENSAASINRHLRFKSDVTDLIIGMVGRIKSQKQYTKAIEIFKLVKDVRPSSKLVILGGYDKYDLASRNEFLQLSCLISELNLEDSVVLLGDIFPTSQIVNEFDVFLNCSSYEGYSIATLEAHSFGIPCVLSDVGGQRDFASRSVRLIPEDSPPIVFSEAVISAFLSHRPFRDSFLQNTNPISPILYRSVYQIYNSNNSQKQKSIDVLFLMNNLGVGGAQRSLVNLVTSPYFSLNAGVCVFRQTVNEELSRQLLKAGTPVWQIKDDLNNPFAFVESVIKFVFHNIIETICFWNLRAEIKILIMHCLRTSSVKFVDVSPGASYYTELFKSKEFQNRIGFYHSDYFDRLDHLVVKYSGGFPPDWFPIEKEKVSCIPNGVHSMPFIEQKTKGHKTSTTIGTVCRITPEKRICWLVESFSIIQTYEPDVDFVIIGDCNDQAYMIEIEEFVKEMKLKNFRLLSGEGDVASNLARIDIFISVSSPHGCSNASLEAMAAGLPIIATNEGGAADQVVHGYNGYLVDPRNQNELASYAIELHHNLAIRKTMGENARTFSQSNFSMRAMAEKYARLFARLSN